MAHDNDNSKPETVGIFRGPRLQTPEDWIGWVLTCWGWHCGHETWFGTLRALVRTLEGLEAAGVVTYGRTLDAAGHRRRFIELTDDGETLARWLVATGGKGAAS